MISGLNSSSLSLAMRTAERANKTLDKMNVQIATGKKVASVKDDGAAYVRAQSAKSDLAQIDGRRFVLDAFDTVIQNQAAQEEGSNKAELWMKDILMRAINYAPGSVQRQQLNAEYQAAYSEWSNSRSTAGVIESGMHGLVGGGWGVDGTTQDSITGVTKAWTLLGSSWADNGHQNYDYAGNGTPMNAIDVLNGSTNNLKNGIATFNAHLIMNDFHTMWGGDARWLEKANDITNKQEDRLNNTIASLTDADMGKTSRDYEMAQTRQSLAYQTVRNAISQYGNVASGLLNNVMGTQRSIRA